MLDGISPVEMITDSQNYIPGQFVDASYVNEIGILYGHVDLTTPGIDLTKTQKQP